MAKFNKDSVSGTVTVVVLLSLVCSIVVSGAAVALKSKQDEQKAQVGRHDLHLPADDQPRNHHRRRADAAVHLPEDGVRDADLNHLAHHLQRPLCHFKRPAQAAADGPEHLRRGAGPGMQSLHRLHQGGHPGDHAGHRLRLFDGANLLDGRLCHLLLCFRSFHSDAAGGHLQHDPPPRLPEDQRPVHHHVRGGAAGAAGLQHPQQPQGKGGKPFNDPRTEGGALG